MANMAYHGGDATKVNPWMTNRRSVLSSNVRSLQAKGWWAMDDKVQVLEARYPSDGQCQQAKLKDLIFWYINLGFYR